MNTRVILSIIIAVFGATAAILPDKKNSSIQLNEKQLLQEMLFESNYVSVDELADLIISGDPSIRLIDVRPASEFKDPIPNSINVPIDSIFSENFIYAFDQNTYKNIIIGEGDVLSTQVWMITRQLGYANNYLLKGGIKEWNSLILDPKYPPLTASQDEFDIYQRRVAAKQYFTGSETVPKFEMKIILPAGGGKKKRRVQGGCS